MYLHCTLLCDAIANVENNFRLNNTRYGAYSKVRHSASFVAIINFYPVFSNYIFANAVRFGPDRLRFFSIMIYGCNFPGCSRLLLRHDFARKKPVADNRYAQFGILLLLHADFAVRKTGSRRSESYFVCYKVLEHLRNGGPIVSDAAYFESTHF